MRSSASAMAVSMEVARGARTEAVGTLTARGSSSASMSAFAYIEFCSHNRTHVCPRSRVGPLGSGLDLAVLLRLGASRDRPRASIIRGLPCFGGGGRSHAVKYFASVRGMLMTSASAEAAVYECIVIKR